MKQLLRAFHVASLEFRLQLRRPASVFLMLAAALLPVINGVLNGDAPDAGWLVRRETRFSLLVVLPLLACVIGSASRQSVMKAHSCVLAMSALAQAGGLVVGRAATLLLTTLLIALGSMLGLGIAGETEVWKEATFPELPQSRIKAGDALHLPLPNAAARAGGGPARMSFEFQYAIILNGEAAPRSVPPLALSYRTATSDWLAPQRASATRSTLRAEILEGSGQPVEVRLEAVNAGLDLVLDRANGRWFAARTVAINALVGVSLEALADVLVLAGLAFLLASWFSRATALLGSLAFAVTLSLLPYVARPPAQTGLEGTSRLTEWLGKLPVIPHREAADSFASGVLAIDAGSGIVVGKVLLAFLLLILTSVVIQKRDVPTGEFRG